MQILVIQNDPTSPISLLGEHLEAGGASLTTILPHHGGTLPLSSAGFDGAVLLGGAQSVRNGVDFAPFEPTCDLIRQFHAEGKPMLGLCLGSQLLARAFDAPVRLHDIFEYGYLPLDVTEEGRTDPLLKGLSSRQHIMQWHEDTFDLPEGAVRLLAGGDTINQAFRYGATTYAFQCHFEVKLDHARHWIENFNHVIHAKLGVEAGNKAIERARGELQRHGEAAMDFCRIVGSRWADLVHDKSRVTAA